MSSDFCEVDAVDPYGESSVSYFLVLAKWHAHIGWMDACTLSNVEQTPLTSQGASFIIELSISDKAIEVVWLRFSCTGAAGRGMFQDWKA